jgi:hypothetical protein
MQKSDKDNYIALNNQTHPVLPKLDAIVMASCVLNPLQVPGKASFEL